MTVGGKPSTQLATLTFFHLFWATTPQARRRAGAAALRAQARRLPSKWKYVCALGPQKQISMGRLRSTAAQRATRTTVELCVEQLEFERHPAEPPRTVTAKVVDEPVQCRFCPKQQGECTHCGDISHVRLRAGQPGQSAEEVAHPAEDNNDDGERGAEEEPDEDADDGSHDDGDGDGEADDDEEGRRHRQRGGRR